MAAESRVDRPHIPSQNGPLHAFDGVNSSHRRLRIETVGDVAALSLRTQARLAGDYVMTGAMYFAREDTEFGRIGLMTATALASRRVVLYYANEPKPAARTIFGASPDVFENYPDDETVFLTDPDEPKLIVPPEFIVTAMKDPLDGLSNSLRICSQVADSLDGVPQGVWKRRAQTRETRFLKRILEQQPGIELSDRSRSLLEIPPQEAELRRNPDRQVGELHKNLHVD